MSGRTLILPGFVLPVRPRGQVLPGHGVLIEYDRISAILPATEARKVGDGAEVVELPRHVLMPGLINMHTHSPMALLRGFADDLAMQAWLTKHIWPAESRHVDGTFVADGTQLAMAEMIRAGTTCFNDNYFYPDEMARVARDAGMRAAIGIPLLDQPTRWARDFDEYLQKGLEVKQQFAGERLLDFTLAPHAPYSVSDRGLDRIAETSERTGLRVHMHCLETEYDVEHSLKNHGVRPLERLERHGILNESLIAVHMTALEQPEIDELADQGSHVVHCPQSNLKLASGICPVTELIGAGVSVCIGTDGPASNNNVDLLEEARFAALLAKGISGDATAVDAVTALEMATINGAMALGKGSDLGSIEVGKKADLCALDLAAPETQPLHNLCSQLVYAASSAQFTDVWIDGRRVMQERALLTLDEAAILETAEHWRARIEAQPSSREVAL